MSASVDELIADLFPTAAPLKEQSSFDDPTPKKPPPPAAFSSATAPTSSSSGSGNVMPTKSSAAAMDDDETAGRPSGSAVVPTTEPRPAQGGGRMTAGGGSHFDDSDDEDDTGGPPSAARPLNPHVTVPFPDFPAGLVPDASGNVTCTLSCVGSPHIHMFHPTVEALRGINQHDVALLHMTRLKVMAMKGAVHATHPEAGNGVDPRCGSAFVVCRQCDHAVVRLQGARWLDGPDGNRDLYLALRNFYPDWSRLAHCHGTHSEIAAKAPAGPLLASDPRAAAYGCQCSWMTVDVEAFTVTTQPGDLAAASGASAAVFRTSTAAGAQEDRRPPLWRSRGVRSGF